MGHNCDTLIIRCMDFRLSTEVIARLLIEAGIIQTDRFDLISVAGAAKPFLGSGAESSFMMGQTETAVKLHGTKKIVLMMHDDCGAYGIANESEEEEVQREDLKRVASLIATKFPNLEVVKLILKGTKTGRFFLVQV